MRRVLERFGKRSVLTTVALWRSAVRSAQTTRALIRRYQVAPPTPPHSASLCGLQCCPLFSVPLQCLGSTAGSMR